MRRLMILLMLLCLLLPAARAADPASAAGFVLVTDVVPDVILEMRYYTTYNFVGDRIDGYEEPVALLTREAAEALKAVSDELLPQGYRLKIYDAYRPQCATDHFIRWGEDVRDDRMKAYFYPLLTKRQVFEQGYVQTTSAHTRGSTVDLTLFDMRTGQDVDMGGPFDWFGSLSSPFTSQVTDTQAASRMLLRSAMEAHGFSGVMGEWWHFTLLNEPYPNTYFTFPVRGDVVE